MLDGTSLGKYLPGATRTITKNDLENNALNWMGDWCGFLLSVTKKPGNTGVVIGIRAFRYDNFSG